MSKEPESPLWEAFRAGFMESGEGYNGETMFGFSDSYERRLRARFEELKKNGKFD